MVILLILSGIICIWLSLSCLRLRADIRYLHEQLGEIERGSHIELAVYSRRQSLLAFCRRLNRVLQEKDASHNRYEKAEKKLKQNITDLAHDIRTPLTGASGYVQLARESTDSIKKEHYLEAAGKRLAELSDMLEELFLYTRLTDEDYSLPKESLKKTYVLPLLSECLLSLYSAFEERGTSPEIDFASEDFCIYAEEEILQRIFLNLIRNALLHGRGGITILQKEDLLIFENPVSQDSIPDTEQLFDRFYKADSARRKGSSGLGLFIVKELTESLGGKVWAEYSHGLLRILLRFPPS
ncbi:MAG: HAMP domain-containing histidine kinase [Lachnospiraceae bacterium]|nr:HAMP domain-containing histidine kinase [Lachnospiraceae bacterium]